MGSKKKQEIKSLLFSAVALFSFLSLVTYEALDVKFVTSAVNPSAHNLAGRAGAYFAWFLYTGFGYSAYLVPLLCLVWAFSMVLEGISSKVYFRVLGSIVLFISASSLFSLLGASEAVQCIISGGVVGFLISFWLADYFGLVGSYIILITLFLLSLHLSTEFLLWPIALGIAGKTKKLFIVMPDLFKTVKEKSQSLKKPKINISGSKVQLKSESTETQVAKPPETKEQKVIPKISKKETSEETQQPQTATSQDKEYKFPDLNFLRLPQIEGKQQLQENLQANANTLEETLRDFNIEAKVVQIERGPVITRFELQPAAGVKIQRIVSLSNDIALSLKSTSVRIVAPIPGKDRVGVEVPNAKTRVVTLREILETEQYKNATSKLTLALGKDITGQAIVNDLGIMPHLLIAGATGSGKTVCVNSIITSILYNASPDEVKFIMVDPKMVELAPFNEIPHLLSPVINDSKKVSAALSWTVKEMESRYEVFAKEAARNIESYNKKVAEDKKLPYLVIIIDELADLMAVASNEIEHAITRLSQLSRAVGIHIILATQRPSVDVITGVIKANFPTRISFKVSSKVDSRTVLDANGADKLIGSGDMLFIPPGSSRLIRAQAPLVTDEEINKVVDFIKKQRRPSYNEDILTQQKKATKTMSRVDKDDEMYEDAVRVILQTGHASVSMLQRRLALGYTRAARLIDAMEQEGIIGTFRGSKARKILVDRQEYLKKMDKGEI
jgi:S-DNA-T family DNA segregation ATPase FtsK/SpoIIIE